MDEQKLLAALTSINVWWNGNPVPERIKRSDNRRKIFYDLSKTCLLKEEIISISGPRQVGKTTLIGQLIEEQIKVKKINPKKIVYIPIDNELINLNCDNILVDCLKVFFDFIVGEAPESLSEKVYVYLDEIQTLPEWARQLKSYYDTYNKIKFVISGSSQTKLYADASESLVGRILFRLILPFKFREFLEYYMPKRSTKLEFSSVNLRKALIQSIKEKKPDIFYRQVTLLKVNISSELPKIKQILDDYLIKGGYPGLLKYTDYDKAIERLKTDLELTVYKDIYKIFKTRNSSDLMTLLTLLASSSGQKVNYSNLANTLGIDRRVVGNFINYAKLVFLIEESPFCKINLHKKVEKMNKVYLIDTGHRNALVGKMNRKVLTESESGLIIQTAVFNHATRLKFFLSKHTNFEICYWEDKDNEVDIVIDLPIAIIPAEVKSKSGSKGLKSIYKFISEYQKSTWGLIITKDELRLEKNILFLPLWAFMLMC